MASSTSKVSPLVGPRRSVEAAPSRESRSSPPSSVQGTLALDLGRDPGPPWPDSATEGPSRSGADVVPVPTQVRQELHRWVVTFTQSCVEIIGGDRPPTQLLRWTTPRIHNELVYRAGVVARASVHAAGRGRGRRPTIRPQVCSVHTCFLSESTVEFCVRVKHGQRSRFLAGRLEIVSSRWQCTALEFG